MKIDRDTRRRFITNTGIIILFIAIVYFLLRGPYLSNSIKRLIIPQLENITRERVIIDKAVINLFPFYVQAKSFKLFDKKGNRLLWITKARAYIDIIGLINNKIIIRKLVLKEPDLTAKRQDIERIIKNFKASSIGKKGKYKVLVKDIKLIDAKINYIDDKQKIKFIAEGMDLDVLTKSTISIDFIINKIFAILPNQGEIESSIKGKIKLRGRDLSIKRLVWKSGNSYLIADGDIKFDDLWNVKEGNLETEVKVFSDEYNRLFAIKNQKSGELSFIGNIILSESEDSRFPEVTLDLKTRGNFYLESLMEILRVKSRIMGRLMVDGEIKGKFPNLQGAGQARLEDAMFGRLPVKDITGRIYYSKKRFSLEDFVAHVYEGLMKGRAELYIPSGNYRVIADVKGIRSKDFFKLIRWTPPLSEGRIYGNFDLRHRKGTPLAVEADLKYIKTDRNPEIQTKNVFYRISEISASLSFKNKVVSFRSMNVRSENSTLIMDGFIDLARKRLNLNLNLKSDDIRDLTHPFYSGIKTGGTFSGTMIGLLKDPEIKGRITLDRGEIKGIPFNNIFADIEYRIKHLTVHEIKIKRDNSLIEGTGSIDFRKAKGLFSLKDPYFRIEIKVIDIPIKEIADIFYPTIDFSGVVRGSISFNGGLDKFISDIDLLLKEGDIHKQKIDQGRFKIIITEKGVGVREVTLKRGRSTISALGEIDFDKEFHITIESQKIYTQDIEFINISKYNIDAEFDIHASGSGRIDNPNMTYTINIFRSQIGGIDAGKGSIKGKLKQKVLSIGGEIAEGRIGIKGKYNLKRGSWNIIADLRNANYDFILKGFFARIPDSVSVEAEGRFKIGASNGKIFMDSVFSSLRLYWPEFSLENRDTIHFTFEEGEMKVKSFSLYGHNTVLSISGKVSKDKILDLMISGNLDLKPLSIVREDIRSIKGKGIVNIKIQGTLSAPEFAGEIGIVDTSIVFRPSMVKVGPINGSLTFSGTRFSFDALSVAFGGGNVTLTGYGNLSQLKIRKLFIDANIERVRIFPTEGIMAEINGDLFYERLDRGANISGNVEIIKARYLKKMDIKKWLLGIKEVSVQKVKIPAFLRDTKIHLKITARESVFIDNNIAQAPLSMNINFIGTLENYGMVGRIEANRGKIFFGGNEFRISEGTSIDFVNPERIEPIFHIVADTYKSDYHIQMSIDGSTEEFILSLYSDPPLSENDILTLLTFGHIGSLPATSGGFIGEEAASILGGDIQKEVQSEIKSLTGVERFEIQPQTTSTGAIAPRITIGKKLFEDKIFVLYSTSIGTTEEQIIRVEYKLSDQWSIVGSRDELGNTGADIKFRFEFR